MPTNFPTSVDNFTNPTANDSLNLPSHSTQHANANDAIEAVESYLLNGGQGLTLVKSQTITSGVTSVEVTSAFSATYDAYKIVISGLTASGATGVNFQVGTSNTGYYNHFISVPTTYAGGSGTLGFTSANNATSYDAGIVITTSTSASGGTIELQNPFAATTTSIQTGGTDPRTTGTGLRMSTGFHNVATSYTSFTLLVAGNTFTGGRISVYGYGKGI